MSKQVDLAKPLSKADMTYLLERDRHEEVAFNAEVHGTKLPKEVVESIRARGITEEATKKRVRAAFGDPEEAADGSGTSEGTRAPDGDDSSASGDDSGQGEGPEKFSDEWFEKATIAQLQPELKERGMPVTGKRDELADRLYEKMVDTGEITDEEDDES